MPCEPCVLTIKGLKSYSSALSLITYMPFNLNSGKTLPAEYKDGLVFICGIVILSQTTLQSKEVSALKNKRRITCSFVCLLTINETVLVFSSNDVNYNIFILLGLYMLYTGSYMSDPVLLNLLNELGKRDKIQGLPSILSLFSQRV